ncbi:hypothetical protein CROQUDRAFT_110232 [Cronartium quercuum f. sp. fusiforme G11]|uniref:Uncharacterized protein n=1 Tax=Cronartium quercuum f. sp. fusiforme G11 TaxID=708437 RepID=A0A9P6NA60_9BASI|nr:hypothetical protein CROQUDRAFT_110232 [Cronartium quercuum f. sp. fusiforme G11]
MNNQVQSGQGAAILLAGHYHAPSLPQFVDRRHFEAGGPSFPPAYTHNMQGSSLSESNADMDRGFPSQATGSSHTGSSTNDLHGPSDKGSETMRPVPLLSKMDVFNIHHKKITVSHSKEENQQLIEKPPSPSQTLDAINKLDFQLENAYVGKVLELPEADDRWNFLEAQAQFDISSLDGTLFNWESYDLQFTVQVGNVRGLESNLRDLLSFKISQGLDKETAIFRNIINLFILLWTLQPLVAMTLKLEDSRALQIKSFEALASIVQHEQYAMEPNKLPRPQIYRYNWFHEYPGNVSLKVCRGRAFQNQYFKIYYCIFGRKPVTTTKNKVILDVTLAMLKDYESTKVIPRLSEKQQDSIRKLALNHAKVIKKKFILTDAQGSA